MFKKAIAMAMVMAFVVASALAQTYAWKGADASVPILIRTLTGETATGTVAATVLNVGIDSVATVAITLTPTKTVATVIGELNAVTNAAGKYVFEAICWEAVSSDTVSNKLLAATPSFGSAWDSDIKWDTSTYLSYTVIPDKNVGTAPVGGYGLTRILGVPTGTGDVTVRVYEDDTEIFQQIFVSPRYELGGVLSTDVYTNVTVNLAVDLGNIRIGSGKRGLVKVTRASTATTGGIGAATTR